MFAEQISDLKIISVLELSWEDVNKPAMPRPYHALSYRIRGNAEFSTNNDTVNVTSGDIIFVPENLGYHLKAKDEHLFCVHFLAEHLPKDKIIKFTKSAQSDFQNQKEYEKLFISMYELWTQKKPGYKTGILSDFYKILSNIQNEQSEEKLAKISINMNKAVQYIHEHFTEPNLTVLKVSEAAFLSDSQFRKNFKKYFNISPLQYINKLRVKYALELIRSGYYTIYTISEMSGFSDTKYFSNTIKRMTGLSPSEHKKQIQI